MALARYGVNGLISDKKSGDSFRKQTTYVAILVKRDGWKIKRVMPEVIFRGQLKEESLQRQSWRMLALADGKAAPRDDAGSGKALAPGASAAPTSRNAPAATSGVRASTGFSEQVIPPSAANAPKPDDQERMRAAQAFREGTEAFNAQQYDKAIRKFEAYLAVNPNDEMGRRRLAMARRMKSGMGFGSLEVSCQPPAQVFLDGKPAGTTPLSLDRVPAGARRLEVRTAQASQSREVDIKPRTLSIVKFYLGDARQPARAQSEPEPSAPPPPAKQTAPAPDAQARKKTTPAPGEAASARGFILEVNGEEATIDLGSNQGVKPGDRFKVMRMKTFIHPVSGKKYFWKRQAGVIEVTQVQEELSLAVAVSSRGELEPGLPIVRSREADSPDSPAGPEALQE
jgi:hypothetical protein